MDTNRKKDEEADKIRELIAECRENLNKIKCDAMNSSQKPKLPCDSRGQERSPCSDRRQAKSDDPCAKYRKMFGKEQDKRITSPCGSDQDDPCAKFRRANEDPCRESPTAKIESQISALAEAKAKSRQCIDKLDKGFKMKIRTEGDPCLKFRNDDPCAKFRNDDDPCAKFRNDDPCSRFKDDDYGGRGADDDICSSGEFSQKFDPCECEESGDVPYQDRVSCKVDLNQMKVNIKGRPEDLKKLDAVQLINLLDKFQCQELIINTSTEDDQGMQNEIPVFYLTHPGNLALMVGIIMVAFLVNTNLCNPRRGCKTRFLLNMLYLGSFAFHYGIALWMSFIRGLTLNAGLSRETFNTVDNLILPKYFAICVFLSAITLYSFLATHCAAPCTSWPLSVLVQVIIECATFLTELITICYIVPAIIKLREATDESNVHDDECGVSESQDKNVEKLAKLNWTISFINTLTVMFMGSNMYYISSKLNIG